MEPSILQLSVGWLPLIMTLSVALTQTCLQSNGGDIPFEDLGSQAGHLPNGSQAIVTSYQFQCCGRVTRWQTRVHPGGGMHRNGVYSIRFQVWRPGPAAESDGCYSLVGEDVYDDVVLTNPGRLADRTVDSSTVISVQPGDVVGYYVVSDNGGNEGIQLDGRGEPEESVWYTDEIISLGGACPFPVGEGRSLFSSTNAAPAISVDIVSTVCPVLLIATATVSTVQTVSIAPRTSLTTPTPQASESPTGDLNKEASGLSVRDIAITAGVSAFVTLVGVVSAAVLILMKKRSAKKASSSRQNILS